MKPPPPLFSHPPLRIAADTWLDRHVHDAAGSTLPVGSLVVRGAEPAIVDTGAACNRDQWFRDVFGLVGDAPLSPTRQIDDSAVRVGLQGLQLVDIRTQLMSVDRMREGAADEYALVRDAWLQRRNYQIHGDRQGEDDYLLPDYLLDDEANPTVPADAMPVPIPNM